HAMVPRTACPLRGTGHQALQGLRSPPARGLPPCSHAPCVPPIGRSRVPSCSPRCCSRPAAVAAGAAPPPPPPPAPPPPPPLPHLSPRMRTSRASTWASTVVAAVEEAGR